MEFLYYLGKGLGWLLMYGTIALAIAYGTLLLFGLIIYSTRYVIWKLILKKETSTEFLDSLAVEKGYTSYQDMRDQWVNHFDGEFERNWLDTTQRLEPEFLEGADKEFNKYYDDLYDIYKQHKHIYNNAWKPKWYILADYKFTNNKEWMSEAFSAAGITIIILLLMMTISGISYYAEHGHAMGSLF